MQTPLDERKNRSFFVLNYLLWRNYATSSFFIERKRITLNEVPRASLSPVLQLFSIRYIMLQLQYCIDSMLSRSYTSHESFFSGSRDGSSSILFAGLAGKLILFSMLAKSQSHLRTGDESCSVHLVRINQIRLQMTLSSRARSKRRPCIGTENIPVRFEDRLQKRNISSEQHCPATSLLQRDDRPW
jgi:hypothetical protein